MNRQYEGFLLIELLVAMAIMSCVAMVLAQYQTRIIHMQNNASRHMQAVTIAGALLDKILAKRQLPSVLSESVDQFDIRYVVEQVPLHKLDLPRYIDTEEPNFYNITIYVTWHDTMNTQHVVHISSGMNIS